MRFFCFCEVDGGAGKGFCCHPRDISVMGVSAARDLLAGECGENSPECVFSSSSHLFFSMWPLLIMNFDSILVDSTGNCSGPPWQPIA